MIISGIGSDHSSNWATTTAQEKIVRTICQKMSVHFLRVIGLCEKTVYPCAVAVYSENLPNARHFIIIIVANRDLKSVPWEEKKRSLAFCKTCKDNFRDQYLETFHCRTFYLKQMTITLQVFNANFVCATKGLTIMEITDVT